MTKVAAPFAAAALLAGWPALTTPVAAQSTGQRLAEIIVYGNDPCPRSTESDIVICVRKSEAERYRIPERLRTGGTRQEREAWANRARSVEMVGRTGIQSCSPVGPAGYTGCLEQMIRQSREEVREEIEATTPPPE